MCGGALYRGRRMRLAQARRDGELRLVVKTAKGWVDVPGAPQLADVAAHGLETPEGEPVAEPEFGPLLDRPGKIICVGRNYREHTREMGDTESPWPETFLRLASTVTGPYDEVGIPAVSSQVDYEGELGVVVGKGGRHISAHQ